MLHSCIVPLTLSLSHTSIVTSSKHLLKSALPCELLQYTITITAAPLLPPPLAVALYYITLYYNTTLHHTTRQHTTSHDTIRHDTTRYTTPQRIGNHYNILLPANPRLPFFFRACPCSCLVLVVSARCIYPRTHSDLAR